MKDPTFLSDLLDSGLELGGGGGSLLGVVGVSGGETLQELRAMASRQQQQLEAQQQLLVARQQRLRFLQQSQESARQQVAVAQEADRLRRLRDKVEAQEAKLARLRALRGQVDQQRSLNGNLTSDLESIRALFNEKEKELALAVARVDQLTSQLEDLRRSRRTNAGHQTHNAVELERLRRELGYRQRLGEQQDQRVLAQRQALGQRQDELARIDQRIAELQARLHRKRMLNQQLAQQISAATAAKQAMLVPGAAQGRPRPVNVAAVEPFTRSDATQDDIHAKIGAQFAPNKNDPKYQTLPYNTKFGKAPRFASGFSQGRDGEENQGPAAEEERTKSASQRPFGTSYTNVVSPGGHSPPGNSLVGHLPASQPIDANGNPVKPKPPAMFQTTSTRVTPLQPHTLSSTPQGMLQEATPGPPMVSPQGQKPPKPALPPKPVVPIKPTPPPRQYPPEKDSDQLAPQLPTGRPPAPDPSFAPRQLFSEGRRARPPPVQSYPKPNVASVQPSRRVEVIAQGMTQDEGGVDSGTDQVDRAATMMEGWGRTKVEELRDEWKEGQTSQGQMEVEDRGTIDVDPTPSGQYLSVVQRMKKGNLKNKEVDNPPVSSHSGPGTTLGQPGGVLRRVSFDPLALLLDAALEGELELVRKTSGEVSNPSAANDEGITALHNAICAGHLDIVRFLVGYGCDVNAQDSDGWTPLHCAASCNNLPMVRFLVEHGACIFATTLSDQETAAEKCEEDEEGFDGCSEYLYSIQEKLGILNGGCVYAVYDYEAQNPDELSFHDGDKLIVLHKGDEFEREWWWAKTSTTTMTTTGSNNNTEVADNSQEEREGYIPRNLLGLYPRVQTRKEEKN